MPIGASVDGPCCDLYMSFNKSQKPNDKSYGSGVEVERGIYEINGFQIRFFTEKEIEELATAEGSMIDMYIQLKWCIQEIA